MEAFFLSLLLWFTWPFLLAMAVGIWFWLASRKPRPAAEPQPAQPELPAYISRWPQRRRLEERLDKIRFEKLLKDG